MSLKKLLTLGAILMLSTGCSTTGTTNNDTVVSSASESQIQELENKVGDRVFFEFDSSQVTMEAQEILKKQAQFMSENPELRFTFEGHADDRGTREYNLGLGERRANAAMQYIISLGIDSKRLKTVSYGKEKPAVLGSNDWAWGQNRRSVTKID